MEDSVTLDARLFVGVTRLEYNERVWHQKMFKRLAYYVNEEEVRRGANYWCDVLVTVLHDMQLTHTDLKPENILFVNSDSELEYDPKAVSHVITSYCIVSALLYCYKYC